MPKPTLHISRLQSLADEEIDVQITHLLPKQRIRLRSSTIDSNGRDWCAEAEFEANDRGEVSLKTLRPLSGSYSGIDAMGLFWSMRPKADHAEVFANRNLEPDSIAIEIDGLPDSKQIIKRFNCAENVQRQEIREKGIVGTLFTPPSTKPLPAVLFIGGSEGGLRESRAALFASHGFVTFALAYFGMENLPSRLENIPLEYFKAAIDWLQNHPAVQGRPIAIHGSSRGGELALLLSAIYPDKVKATAAIAPSSALWGKAWSFKGKILPSCAPEEFQSGPTPDLIHNEENPLSLTPIFLEWMKREDFGPAQIPVEKITAPLLIISGGKDEMWPAQIFAEKIMQRLDAFQSNIFRQHLNYPNAGHYFSRPYFPSTCQKVFHRYAQMWLSFGGQPAEHASACKDSWFQTIEFLKKALC